MRIQDQDKEQVRIALHSEEAGRLLADLKQHASELEDVGDLIEALEDAGVEPLEDAAEHRLEFPS